MTKVNYMFVIMYFASLSDLKNINTGNKESMGKSKLNVRNSFFWVSNFWLKFLWGKI